ncbi:MAG: homocysteine S-methyltransferase family protein [Planctomycetes bacterium]|nr:homocysteine S-methyltransferase family protein [Planctomycetota bacterium]
MRSILKAIQNDTIRKVDQETPVLIHANAGMPIVKDGKTSLPETPEMMAPEVKDLVNACANIIGCCCGTTPDHIRAFVREIRGAGSAPAD